MSIKNKNTTQIQPPTRRVETNCNNRSNNNSLYYDPTENLLDYKNKNSKKNVKKNSTNHLNKKTTFKGNIPRSVVILLAVIAAVFFSFLIIGAGFLIVSQPDQPTEFLSAATNLSDKSPFNKEELTKSAVATKNFSFIDNSFDKLFVVLYDINSSCQKDSRAKDDGTPDLESQITTVDESNKKLKAQIIQENINDSKTSEKYLLKGNEINHLQDCFKIVQLVKIFITFFAAITLVLLIVCTYSCGVRLLGRVLYWSALVTLFFLILLGVLAVINFNDFFENFHHIFFAKGGWTFSEDSLLICSLPTAFWTGIVIIWLLLEFIICSIFINVGSILHRRF